jgi:hypothetical protein
VVRVEQFLLTEILLNSVFFRLIIETTWLDPGLTISLDANGSPGVVVPQFFSLTSVGSSVRVNTPPRTDFGSIVTKASRFNKSFRLMPA